MIDAHAARRASATTLTLISAIVLASLTPSATSQAKAKKEDAKALSSWGFVEKDGRWKRKADVEKQAKGMVQHPDIGIWIPEDKLAEAKGDKYPVDDEWLSAEDANKLHRTWSKPWVLLGDNVELRTTYKLADAKNILNEAESAVSYAKNVLWDPVLKLPKRVLIFAFKSQDQYQEFGNEYDETGFSSHGAFWSNMHEERPVCVYYGAANWGPYYLKHGVGLAISSQLLIPLGVAERHWIHTGFGSLSSRWSNAAAAAHFGGQYLQKGGVRSLKSFPKNFTISGDLSAADLDWNIYQAGILVSYLTGGPSKKVSKAWNDVRAAIKTRGKKTSKTVGKFQKVLLTHQKQLRAYLERLIKSK